MSLAPWIVALGMLGGAFPFHDPVKPARPVQAMAHRGLWRIAPENSRHAIHACATHFVEWAEVDVRLTKDGRHVLIHDADLAGATVGRGPVRESTFDQIRALEAGEPYARRFAGTRILGLDEALRLAKGTVNLYLDCKEVDPDLLIREVRAAGMERQVAVYASGATLEALDRAVGGGSPVPLMKKWRPDADGPDAFARPRHLAAVEIDADRVDRGTVARAKAAGLKVQAKALGNDWDRPEVWGRLVDAEIDWIQTDWPVEFHAFLHHRRHGLRPVAISCHRGASRQAPENTLAAIEAAVAIGAEYVELDVRTTKDGKLVLMHDATVNRTTNGRGKVSDLTLDEIRKLDAGGWFGSLYRGAAVPTFDEALAALKGRAKLYCDAKDVDPAALAAALRRGGMSGATVVYGSADFLKKLKTVDPNPRRMPALRRLEDFDHLVAEVAPYAFDVTWSILDAPLVERCRTKGIAVFSDALGLNESVESYRRAIRLGVDLIQTDYPERVLRAVEIEADKAP